jgi:hypothetical protein
MRFARLKRRFAGLKCASSRHLSGYCGMRTVMLVPRPGALATSSP